MADILDLMPELFFPKNPGGVCHGLAFMAERAYRSGQYNKFKERMDFYKGLKENTLESLIKAAQLKQEKIKALQKTEKNWFTQAWSTLTNADKLSKEEMFLLETKTFFSQILMFFYPNHINELLDLKGPTLTQSSIPELETWLFEKSDDKAISPLPIPYEFPLFSTTENNYLRSFLETAKTTSAGLVISRTGHTVHLFFENDRWYLTNHSELTDYPSLDKLMDDLNKIFLGNRVGHVFCQLFSDTPLTPSLQNELTSISSESFEALSKSDNIDRVDALGVTPLQMAAHFKLDKIADFLLQQAGTAINHASTENKITPLYEAAQFGHMHILNALLNKPQIAINQASGINEMTALCVAAVWGHSNVVRALLAHKNSAGEKDIAVNQHSKDGKTPLYFAAYSGHSEVMSILLEEKGIDMNQCDNDGITPLLIAASFGRIDAVNLLLQYDNIDLNKGDNEENCSPLYMAAFKGHINVVIALLQHPNIEVNEETMEMIINLIEKKDLHPDVYHVNVNHADSEGNTLLHIAAQKGYLDIVNALLKHKDIEVNKVNNKNVTPLCLAAAFGHTEIVDALLQHRNVNNEKDIDVNQPMADGTTPLIIAAYQGQKKVVERLLEEPNILFNHVTKAGVTAIEAATWQSHFDVAHALLQHRGVVADQYTIDTIKAQTEKPVRIVVAQKEVLPSVAHNTSSFYAAPAPNDKSFPKSTTRAVNEEIFQPEPTNTQQKRSGRKSV